ncbi:MAG: hypothetical protein GF331_07085 [Chitinivibrionales bacterium]|nr:hypothetical protein [Chitinivibrionales bacterium]
MTWRRYLRVAALSAVVLCLATGNAFGADPFAAADITVTDSVVATDVEPLGANMGTMAGGTNFAINNHVWSSGFEPMVYRRMARINRAGDDGHEWFEFDQEGGPSVWNLVWTGLGNGAECTFYRMVDAAGQPLDYNGGTDMGRVDDAHHVIKLGVDTIPMPGGDFPEGGWICDDDRDGDTSDDMERIYIKNGGLGLRFGDYVYIKLKTNYIGPETSPPDLREHWYGDRPLLGGLGGDWTGAIVPHPGTIPSEFDDHGETCLEVTAPNDQTVAVGQHVYYRYQAEGEGQWYSQLHPGASYRVSVWLRQEGLGNNGEVRFVFRQEANYEAASQTTPWNVTGEWQQYTYDFTGPPYPGNHQWHIAHGLEFRGPGKLWIDNFVLYRNDAKHNFKPFGPHEITFDEILRSYPQIGKKPALRFYGVIFHPSSLEAMLTNYSNSTYAIAWNAHVGGASSMTIAQAMDWAYQSGDSPQTRIVPYLTCVEEYLEEEWMGLVEYLGVPYDPGTDTPQSKPYAYRRYVQRGHGVPWTEEFREILVEYGNETWHQGAGGYGWHGWGRPGFVHQGGKEYGLFARYMFDDHVMQMPAWSQYNLGEKIKFTLGGNYSTSLTSYVELAVQQGASITYAGHANYVGPKWETNDSGFTSFNDHGMQETLIARYTGAGKTIAGARLMRDSLNAHYGTDYRVIAYEGGPSGYWQNPDNPEIDELYGKSLGMGVAALDAWLYSSENGYGHQCYLGLGSGKWWSSHTPPEAGGLRPHPGWQALTMRNNYAFGDTMTATVHNTQPTLDRDGEDIPLVASYCLKNSWSYSVFVLSRKLDGNHDGVDFGTGYTPVTLHLPFTDPQQVTLHRLASPDGTPADPRANNRGGMNIEIITDTIPLQHFSQDFVINENTGGTADGMPPGTVYLYTFILDTLGLSVQGPDMAEMMRQAEGTLTDGSVSSRAWGQAAQPREPVVSTSQSQSPVSTPRDDAPAVSSSAAVGQSEYAATDAPVVIASIDKSDMAAEERAPEPKRVSVPRNEPETQAPAEPAVDEYEEHDMVWRDGAGMLPMRAIDAGPALEAHPAANTIDRDLRTRWAPRSPESQWIVYDLGEVRNLSSLSLVWYHRRRHTSSVRVEVSLDNDTYSAVAEATVRGRGTNQDRIAFDEARGRYVRVALQPRKGDAAATVYEIGLAGDEDGLAQVE